MAKIVINKGFISHGGRLYKAGEIVTITDNAYAKRIVARSGGDFDFFHGEAIPAANEDDAKATSGATPDADGEEEDGAGGVSESDTEGGAELPAIDAIADMQTAKTAKGKKK